MATTTNFGWETPDDTDLVKDGAAAIRTVANSIDTSFVDLKGGTTGQILSKASNTDLDYTWIANDTGDITGVTAGTGISGGGTTGTVTITNSMATAIDAKGDLVAGTGADTFDRLAVGANNTVLTADSSTTTGLKWATPASGGMTSIATGSLSGSAVNITTIAGTYNNLQLVIRNFKPATDNASIQIRLNNVSSAGAYATLGQGSDVTDFSWTQTEIAFGYGNDNSTATGFHILNIYDYANAVTWKMGDYYSVTVDSSAPTTDYNMRSAKFAVNATTAITEINILCSSGNFTSGDYILYGVK